VPDKSPQRQIAELKDLVVGYAKQETLEPLRGLGRYLAFGLAAALLASIGLVFVGIGVLRLVQTDGFGWIDGAGLSSWVPYLLSVVVLGGVAAVVWLRASKRSEEAGPR
jgi:hypothetical protein